MGKRNKRRRNKNKQPVFYFAFGSNLSAKQMAERCPSARFISEATLDGYALEFAGWSRGWGGSVANVRKCGKSYTAGVIWQISKRDLKTLDRFEGHPFAYRRQLVNVEMSNTHCQVYTYIMDMPFAAGGPSAGYVARIAEGYDQFKLNEDLLWDAIRDIPEEDAFGSWYKGYDSSSAYGAGWSMADAHEPVAVNPGAAPVKLPAAPAAQVSRGFLSGDADPSADRPRLPRELEGPLYLDDVVSDDPAVVQAMLDGFVEDAEDSMLDEIEAEIRRQNEEFEEQRTLADVMVDPFGVSDDPSEFAMVSVNTK